MNKLTLIAFCTTLSFAGAHVLAQTPSPILMPTVPPTSRSEPMTVPAPSKNMLSRADSRLLNELAESNAGAISTGRIALERSQNSPVKVYAQRMVDDHTSAQTELRALASSKGLAIPSDAELMRKAPSHGLTRKSGSDFDQAYAENVAAKDHGRTLKLLEKAQRETADPDIKALALKMIPSVEEHVRTAATLPGAQKASAKVMKTHAKDSAKTARTLERDATKVR